MAAPAVLSLRPAMGEDRSRLANLLHFETYVHRHLDWRRPLDWLGRDPYLVLESGGRLNAALACQPDPPGVAWVRIFAVATRLDPAEAWAMLWQQIRQQLVELGAETVAAIPLQDWFLKILSKSDFQHAHNVVVLDWNPKNKVEPSAVPSLTIRRMEEKDLEGIYEVDRAAFNPLWQNSLEAIQMAFNQSGFATLIESAGKIAAYQITTRSSQGLHLARLATSPEFQGQGLGSALVKDVQMQARRGQDRLTVNTQDINTPSLGLYKKLGFKFAGESFPVYQYQLG
ncbi:MAG: GNAT family N-acetyltransferase [Chloroflexi bacterium]|nr:GNAT family N-acetyltransferase [Chloroflexota bacterium]